MKRSARMRRGPSGAVVLGVLTVLLLLLGVPLQAGAAGSRTLAQVTGVTRTGLVNWLESHRTDGYYIGTPYVGGDWRSPNGDISFNGAAGMNCTGFVWHAYTKAGASGIPGIEGWLDFILNNDLEHYNFATKSEMLSSGILEKGDVIWIWDGDMFAFNPYHHVGIFWGSTPSEDRFWHSHDSIGANAITAIMGKTGYSSFTVVKTDDKGFISLVKVSEKPAVTEGNSDFSLQGAKFGIYTTAAATGSPVATLTTNASGRATSKGLSPGTYYVKETLAPPGYDLNPTIFRVVVTSGKTTRIGGTNGTIPDPPAKGMLELTKRSGWPEMSDGNISYSLYGALYTVYTDSACTQAVAHLVTDGAGYACSLPIDAGSYFVKEAIPSQGYALDETVYPVTVRPNLTVTVNGQGGTVFDQPQHNPLDIVLYKVDAETGEGDAQGAATLADAQFEIRYYAGLQSLRDLSWVSSTQARKTWIMRTDEEGIVRLHPDYLLSGDDLITDAEGNYTIGLGTVVNRETKAPTGYLADITTLYALHITSVGVAPTVTTYAAPIVADRIKRGDLDLIKASEGTYGRMGAVPFQVTSKTTGESHIIVTDANGYASTAAVWNPHSQNTNAGLTCDDGVWFGEIEALDDTRGALPYDMYLIEELSCPANSGRTLIEPFEITISRDSHAVSLGTLLNPQPPVPSISTSAVDGQTGTKFVSTETSATITDTVSFASLLPAVTYELHGVLMDKASGERLSIDGEEVWATASFTAPEGDRPVSGVIELTFTLDARELGERDLVVFEYLYRDENLVTTHEDITDLDQTITITPPPITPPPPPSRETTPTSREETPTAPGVPATGDFRSPPTIALAFTLAGSLLTVMGEGFRTSSGWPSLRRHLAKRT